MMKGVAMKSSDPISKEKKTKKKRKPTPKINMPKPKPVKPRRIMKNEYGTIE